jgi:hypothetical protein
VHVEKAEATVFDLAVDLAGCLFARPGHGRGLVDGTHHVRPYSRATLQNVQVTPRFT